MNTRRTRLKIRNDAVTENHYIQTLNQTNWLERRYWLALCMYAIAFRIVATERIDMRQTKSTHATQPYPFRFWNAFYVFRLFVQSHLRGNHRSGRVVLFRRLSLMSACVQYFSIRRRIEGISLVQLKWFEYSVKSCSSGTWDCFKTSKIFSEFSFWWI